MKNNLITLFNQLTSNSLADYNLFNDLLENHYEKIKYFYSLLEGIRLNKIHKIYCETTKKSIRVTIEPHEVKYINDIIFHINANKNYYVFAKHFIIDLIEEGPDLIVVIKMNKNEKENDIYESRFI